MATHKQKLVARHLVHREIDSSYSPSDTEIVKKVYKYPQKVAEKDAFRTINSDGVIKSKLDIRAAFERRVKDGFLVKKYKRLLDAEQPLTFKGVKTGDSVPDLAVQSEMLKIGFKVKGLLVDQVSTTDARSVTFNLSGGGDVMSAAIDRLAAMLPAIDPSRLPADTDDRAAVNRAKPQPPI